MPTQSSTKKAPARLSRSAAKAKGEALPDVWQDTARRQKSRDESNGTPARTAVIEEEEEDIFDDIEGALGVEKPAPTKKRQTKAAQKEDKTRDELQEPSTTPKRGRLRSTKNVQSASRSAFKGLVSNYKHEEDPETDTPDELADTASPSKRTKTPRSAARKIPVAKSTGRKKKEPSPAGDEQDKEEEVEIMAPITATPSKAKKRSKPAKTRIEIPDTEDELAKRPPPSTTKKALERRRQNRADHTFNRFDVESSPALEMARDDDDMDVDGNSLVESVLDPTEPSPFNKPPSAQKAQPAPAIVFGHLPAGRESDLLKTIVMERITGKRPSPLVGLDDEYKSVHQLVEHTVTAGEGNSLLLIGARGSGKTALVNKVLSEVSKDNAQDYHVIRLNGFIHTDDKIALREIWRQLGKEMDVEDDGSGPGKNYADTLQTLLALLSHPSEQTGEHTDHVAKAVIFIMDEFDLFAQHPRQTLLYNLFDIAQSRKAPIAVLGLTTRIDVTNSLEKRVKSRFSHRYVHLSLAKSFTAFQEICKACLIVQPDQLSVEERGILAGGSKTTPAKKPKKDTNASILDEWNANIEVRAPPHLVSPLLTSQKLFTAPSFLTTHLAPTFHLTKSVPTALSSFLLPTSILVPNTSFTPMPLTPPDSKLSLLPSLSTLALSLLIATARLDIIHDSDTCNFNMAYDEYVTLASKARIQSAAGGMSASGSTTKVWGKDVARREWEGLVELGFIMPVVQGQAGGFGMCRCDVALEEIGGVLKGEKGVDRGLERWCRAI
jgi:origin recognition complex subunit 4